MSSFKAVFAVDAVLLLVYILASIPTVTGVALHEVIGIFVLGVVIVHVVMHFDHLVETFRVPAHRRGVRLAKSILDLLLVLVLMTCCVSGLMVSGFLLPALGLYATGYWLWGPLHAASAKMLLALLLVHVAANVPFLRGALAKVAQYGRSGGDDRQW